MRQISKVNISINAETLMAAGIVVLLTIAAISFFYTLFQSFVKPLFFVKEIEVSTTTFDSSLDEAVLYIKKRRDLTSATPSASLNKEGKNSVTAEVVNGSGVALAAKTLADALEPLGITVSQLGNSETEANNTVVALKDSVLSYKDIVVEKIGTKSAEIKFEKLEDSYPFDIRIVIGK